MLAINGWHKEYERVLLGGLTCDSDDYYKHTIGVTVLNENNLKLVRLKVNRSNAPYVITKPLHNSQKLIEKLKDGSIVVEIKVHLNFELERLVLGFGESIEVLRPKRLRGRIHKNLINATNNYID